MFKLFASKGVTHLRSVFTDYELINQIFQKLKDLNDSEIRARKGLRDNNIHKILEEIHRQDSILCSIDSITKVKNLRIGELNKAQAEKIKKRLRDLRIEMQAHTKEHQRHTSALKSKEDKQHLDYLEKHHADKINRYRQEMANMKKLLNETENIRNNLRKACKKSLEDYQRLIHNV